MLLYKRLFRVILVSSRNRYLTGQHIVRKILFQVKGFFSKEKSQNFSFSGKFGVTIQTMGQLSLTIVTSFVVVVTYYLVMFSVFVSATPIGTAGAVERPDEQSPQTDTNRNGARLFKPLMYAYNFNRNIRAPFSNSIGQRLVPAAISHSKMQPLELDLLVDDDDFLDKSKRYDDYGHMRFGKRAGGDDQFDDYGHMRFGKRYISNNNNQRGE